TVVRAEHRLERVMRYPDRIIALDDGRIFADRPPADGLGKLPDLPPPAGLGKARRWHPLPRTVKEARPYVRRETPTPPPARVHANVADREPLLQVRDLHFSYNGAAVLQGVDLSVGGGEIVVLL